MRVSSATRKLLGVPSQVTLPLSITAILSANRSGEGASNADALALAAGKLIGKAFSDGRGVKADFLEQLIGAGSLFAFGTTLKGRDHGYVFGDGEVGKQPYLLNDVTDPSPERDRVPFRRGLALDVHRSLGRLDQAVDQPQRGGFA